jgi:hypothetical protein
VKSRLLLNIVVTQSAAILKLLTGKDKTLLIRRNTFLVLNLGFDVVNGVRGLDIKCDGLTSEGLYENLKQEMMRYDVYRAFTIQMKMTSHPSIANAPTVDALRRRRCETCHESLTTLQPFLALCFVSVTPAASKGTETILPA